MFSQINWTRRALLFVIALMAALSDAPRVGRTQVVGPTAPAPVLTGKWKLDTGEIITITQNTRNVTALFTPSVRCLNNSTRTILFSGELKITGTGDTATAKLEGDRFWACTRTPEMVTECGVQELFMTKFRADVSPFSITGESLRPHYDFEMVGGRRTNCRRNAAKDEWGGPFSLTPLCRPSTPWFDKDTSCAEAQRPVITTSPGHVVLSICGSEIYRHSFDDQPYLQEYATALVNRVKQQIGSTVCCQSFRNALRTGQPCNPGSDVDCDGRPNQSDEIADAPFPDINIFSIPPGASVAPFPAGLDPDDPNFLPGSTAQASRNVGDCDCKWELIRGVLNCGTGGQQHSYVATWRCPTSGAEVITTKYATASTPCP